LINFETNRIENEDSEFLFNVYASSRMEEVVSWGWGKEQIIQFLQMQYDCQKRSYEIHYPNLETRIITFKNEKIGRLLLADCDDKLTIVDITLLPNYQNKGIGKNVLLDLLMNAKRQNKVVELKVFHNNEQAIRLYKRLGFQQVSSRDMYIQMEWKGNELERK